MKTKLFTYARLFIGLVLVAALVAGVVISAFAKAQSAPAQVSYTQIHSSSLNMAHVIFDQALDDTSAPPISAFDVSNRSVTEVSIRGSTLTLTVSTNFNENTDYTVTYTPGTPALESANDVAVPAFQQKQILPYTNYILRIIHELLIFKEYH